MKMSRPVTGVSRDKFANAHQVVPEVTKEAQFKDYYPHAVGLAGLSAAASMD